MDGASASGPGLRLLRALDRQRQLLEVDLRPNRLAVEQTSTWREELKRSRFLTNARATQLPPAGSPDIPEVRRAQAMLRAAGNGAARTFTLRVPLSPATEITFTSLPGSPQLSLSVRRAAEEQHASVEAPAHRLVGYAEAMEEEAIALAAAFEIALAAASDIAIAAATADLDAADRRTSSSPDSNSPPRNPTTANDSDSNDAAIDREGPLAVPRGWTHGGGQTSEQANMTTGSKQLPSPLRGQSPSPLPTAHEHGPRGSTAQLRQRHVASVWLDRTGLFPPFVSGAGTVTDEPVTTNAVTGAVIGEPESGEDARMLPGEGDVGGAGEGGGQHRSELWDSLRHREEKVEIGEVADVAVSQQTLGAGIGRGQRLSHVAGAGGGDGDRSSEDTSRDRSRILASIFIPACLSTIAFFSTCLPIR
ncbi:hypothetical protein T492DRAFT_847781 [Pavlovales sp. CCMP2436]|nr:hypothetical protein T492DRAFT_847781 [Pavlovales sp. CCMP2436]